ncbi:MAG: PspA/IM30 family protein [Verrucomicrobiota bacterium]
MKKIKRWTASIVTSFDNVIKQVENHEAVVTSSIKELQEAAARAKVKLGRLKRDLDHMESKVSQLKSDSSLWQDRAVKLKDSDKAKAIECLRRRKRIDEEIKRLETEIPKHSSLMSRFESDVSKLETRIEELKRKKRTFSCRESRAKALSVAHSDPLEADEDLEDIFERWEIKLTEAEIGSSLPADTLEDEFLKKEEEEALEAELDSLS